MTLLRSTDMRKSRFQRRSGLAHKKKGMGYRGVGKKGMIPGVHSHREGLERGKNLKKIPALLERTNQRGPGRGEKRLERRRD